MSQERVAGFTERKGLTSGELLGKFGELQGKSGKLAGNLWIAAKFHSERTSGEVAEKLLGERPGTFQNRVFGEGLKSARGDTAILGRGDHTRNMFETCLHTAYCRQTIALETAEIMQ